MSDKGMAYWSLHKKNQLPSAMGLRGFYFQSEAGGSPLTHSARLVSTNHSDGESPVSRKEAKHVWYCQACGPGIQSKYLRFLHQSQFVFAIVDD